MPSDVLVFQEQKKTSGSCIFKTRKILPLLQQSHDSSTMASENPSLTPWEKFASSWDEGMGDKGNDYFRYLELPILEKLVKPAQVFRALDLATGNGLVARWLAQKGAECVVATDGAPAMLEYARARTEGSSFADRISYNRLDVTNQTSWDGFIGSKVGSKVSFGLLSWRIPASFGPS
jgi:SAM-dependent methyltransferase